MRPSGIKGGFKIGIESHRKPAPFRVRSSGLVAIVLGSLTDALIPCRCLNCEEIEPGSMPLGLCTACRRRLEPIGPAERVACEICGTPLFGREPDRRSGDGSRCLPCRRRRSPVDRLYAGWSYRPPLDDVVLALKFRSLPYLGVHLGWELGGKLPPGLAIDALVPVPLHWRRAWRRGYNQAHEIARGLSRRRRWRIAQMLRRRKATRPQSGLDRGPRRGNLRAAFEVRRGRREAVRGRRLLLTDDVYTTGATAEAAARALKSAGASWVGVAVAARTPDSTERPASGQHRLTRRFP
ncbi:MAG: ComF family protein [Thermoanaerobaculia bacterium]